MVNNYRDDEPVTVSPDVPKENELGAGKVRPDIFNKTDAPMEKTDLRLVVELMGSDEAVMTKRGGVDIVTILDVSTSMIGKRLEKLVTSMQFLVKKLSPIDRLSIVTFSSGATRLCPLSAMNKIGQAKIELLINNLFAGGYTNISPGLQEAVSVLAQRRQHQGRTSAIMLMSDGELTQGCAHPSTVDISSVPVYTFGLGQDHDSQMLQDIAKRSKQGTYSVADVEGSDTAGLNIAFASCLAGLLSVVVQDLELTVTSTKDSKIQEVRAGNYKQTRVNDSVTITFGNLYNREKRNTTVFLNLPAVQDRMTSEVLEFSYNYRSSSGGKLNESNPVFASVTRITPATTKERIEVTNEIARGDTVTAIQTARKQADANNLPGARNTLNQAKGKLEKLNPDANELIKALTYEVTEFLRLLKDEDTYKHEGRAFALSSELSHGLQRFATRGNDATQLVALATPLATLFANQALTFDKDKNIPVPSSAQDQVKAGELNRKSDAERAKRKEEVEKEKKTNDKKIEVLKKNEEDRKKKEANKNSPLVLQGDTLTQSLDEAIESLVAIQRLIEALQSA